MNKNIGPFLAFNKDWFDKNQKVLIWLLNSKLTKRLSRWILRIRKHDIGYDSYIVQLLPNCYTVFRGFNKDKVVLSTDFRTHPKYAKRIYFAFRPLWWAIHAWDSLFADRFVPQWSYGFDTLTAYPAAGNNTPVDGAMYVNSSNALLSTLKESATGTVESNSPSANFVRLLSGTTTDRWNNLYRFICLFDTSSLGANASITQAILSLYIQGKEDNGTAITPSIDIYTVNTSATNQLTSTDFAGFGTTSQTGSEITYNSVNTSNYNDFTFNATGIGNINKTGISKFGTREVKYDVGSNTPTWSNSTSHAIYGSTADETGTSQDPKLVVTYSTSAIKTINGLAIASVKTVNGLAIGSVKTINGLA